VDADPDLQDELSEEELAADAETLKDLRKARRHRRFSEIHWIDAFYNVYLTGLVGIIVVIVVAGRLNEKKLHGAGLDHFVQRAPTVLGFVIAVAVAVGLRSGGRGGPITLEAPVVQHELLAPLPRERVVRGPAVKQLRFLAFAGFVLGAVIGLFATREIHGNPVAPVLLTGATFSLSAVLASASAMVACGHRWRWWFVKVLGVALVAWSAVDVATDLHTSPLTWLASLAFWSLKITPLALVSAAFVIVVVVLAVRDIGNLSIEAARRRSGLVSQLRFAVTLQDVRTVVLLRRQLSQEKPRARPWIHLRRREGRVPAIWKRDFIGLMRFPLVRIVRMVVLGAIAGLCLGLMWHGTPAMVVGAGLALYVAGYDAVEPLAQEVDHPTRWEGFPEDPGRVLLLHLFVAVVAMLVVCGVATATSLLLVPASVVGVLAAPTILIAAAGATAGAAVSTALGVPNAAGILGLGQDLMGFVLAARLVIPPAITVAALAPLLLAGHNPDAIQTARVSNALTYSLFAVFGAGIWLRYRKPSHI
jgi:hypothetical protein